MSYFIYVHRFRDGQPHPLPAGVFEEMFLPVTERREPEFDVWVLRTPDGGTADIYANPDERPFTGFAIDRFRGALVLDLIAEYARRADAVIVFLDRPTALTNPAQSAHLPSALTDTVLIHDGAEFRNLLEAD